MQDIDTNDELRLSELVAGIKDHIQNLWNNKVIIVGLAVLLGIGFGLYAWQQPIIYKANLTFMINEEEGSKGGGMSSVLSQFGLGGGGSNSLNLDKLVALSTSRTIVHSTLLDSVEINGEKDRFGNFIIRELNLHEEWSEILQLNNYLFPEVLPDLADEQLNRALNTLYGKLMNINKSNGILSIGYNDDTQIVTLSAASILAQLTRYALELHFKNLSDFYIFKTIERHQSTVEVLAHRKDSVQQLLLQKESRLAQLQDQSAGVFMKKDFISLDKLQRETTVLGLMYAELVKNYETATFMLDNTKPVFQVIDRPYPPIGGSKKGSLKQFIIGCLIGGIIISAFFFVKKVFTDALVKENAIDQP